MAKPSRLILPIIVFSQFCCTSLWFAGNAVMSDLIVHFNLHDSAIGHLTSAVQLGFISGTLFFAIMSIADRFSPSKVFFVCAVLAAVFNLGISWNENSLATFLTFRIGTGFFLAGIYPVGMKIASDYYEKGLGVSLGYLVGALVLGTAFPHLLKGHLNSLPWESVLFGTSFLALLGGLLMLVLVPDGPYRKKGGSFDLTACFRVFREQKFRSAALGYFGHMWELYAFWTFVPVMLALYGQLHPHYEINISLWSFAIIGVGEIACVVGGYLALVFGTKRVATTALSLSLFCCIISPFMFLVSSFMVFSIFLLFWGMVVIADSPLFSTLVAQNADSHIKGTALTIVNSIGFAITIISIQLLSWLHRIHDTTYIYLILVVGPIIGLIALMKGREKD
jgi:MFS family permease